MEKIRKKSELQIVLEEKAPKFLNEYKELILSVVEDYVYIPEFMGRQDYIYDFFEKSIKDIEFSEEISNEIVSIKKIARDIADGKYFQKLEII